MLKHRRSCRALWADCHFSSAGSWESRLKNENPHRTVLKLHFLHATQNQLHATQEFNTGLLQNQANAYRNLSDVMKKYRTEHRAPREETPAAGGGKCCQLPAPHVCLAPRSGLVQPQRWAIREPPTCAYVVQRKAIRLQDLQTENKKGRSPQGGNPYRKEHLEKATLSTTQATRKHTFTALHHTTGDAVPTYTQIAPFPKRPHTNLSGKCWTLETCMASVNIFLQKAKTKSSPSSEHRWVLLRAGNVTVESYRERAEVPDSCPSDPKVFTLECNYFRRSVLRITSSKRI